MSTSYKSLHQATTSFHPWELRLWVPRLIHTRCLSLILFTSCQQVSVVIRLPLEIIKSRTQISAYGPDTTLRKSVRMVWKNEGLKGFWRGYGGTLGRDVSQVAAHMCS